MRLTLLMGLNVPAPAPPALLQALESVEVTHDEKERSGFRITFKLGRSGPSDLLDYALLALPVLKPFARVVLMVTFGAVPRVLMDGVVTHHQLHPGDGLNPGKLTLMGEDLTVLMDMEPRQMEHIAQPEAVIAAKILASYAPNGIVPMVVPPPSLDVPLPTERVPVQQDTDFGYLRTLAGRFGYVFHLIPGPAPGVSMGYWGPPVRAGVPQRALSVNMGAETNVRSVSFQNDALATTFVEARVQDRQTNQPMPIKTFASTRIPLAALPAWAVNMPRVRKTIHHPSGLTVVQAMARAQGATDASTDNAVTATGELDAARYGTLLEPRGLVGLRGVGYLHDGFWYVRRVTHKIKPGEYTQSFTLAREGWGSTTPVVPP